MDRLHFLPNENKNNPLYLQLYEHYKNLIAAGTLKSGTRLPSIRRCASELNISRTTVESAYTQLAAEGYVMPKANSGFYVCKLNYEDIPSNIPIKQNEKAEKTKPLYDFSTSSVDYKSFNFDLWRRYLKSALRSRERLLSYGEPQGEYDLRVALSRYAAERRGVVCTPEQIVVGAGVQILIHILCSLTGIRSPVAFTGSSFIQGKAIFEDRGFETFTFDNLTTDFSPLKNAGVKIIYTYPSHTTPWGDVMPIQTRLSLLSFAAANDCLIIEDDYDSEFRYYSRPVPSLQSLDGGQKVVYFGTFSKLLLPSLRISFMVLPPELIQIYEKRGHLYNQTASKAEQIALCQFIRDGHLSLQIRKAGKLYMSKSRQLCLTVNKVFGDLAVGVPCSSSFLILLEVKSPYSSEKLAEMAENKGILVRPITQKGKNGYPQLLLSCSGVAEEDFEDALILLKKALF